MISLSESERARERAREMIPLKLVRSLILGETIHNPFLTTQNPQNPNNPHFSSSKSKSKSKTQNQPKTRTPFLLFTPTSELITDTYRLATLAREIGLDLYPNPSLSHIIFSWPSLSPSPATSSSSSSYPSLWSTPSLSSSCSSSWSLPNDAVPLPFPSLSNASLSHLRCFVGLSKGFFRLVFINSGFDPVGRICDKSSNWDCFSVFLISRRNGDRIDSMEGFSRALAGAGWSFFKTNNNPSSDSVNGRFYGSNSVYLFRKMDINRVRMKQANGESRVRELRLPHLDFVNAPLRILQYILLMTDDIFYLA